MLWKPLELLLRISETPKSNKALTAILLTTIILSALPYYFIWKYQMPIDITTNILYAQGMTYFISNILLPINLSFVILLLHQITILFVPVFDPLLTYYHVIPVFLMLGAVHFLTYAYTKLKNMDLDKITNQLALLDAKQARINNLFDNEFYGIAVHMDGKIWEINDTFSQFLDYESKDIVGENLISIIDPQDRQEFVDKLREQKNFYMELMGIAKGGAKVPLEIISKHYTEAGNDLEICFIRDVTGRKMVNDELKRQKNYLQKILDAYPHSLYIVDLDGTTIKAANKLAQDQSREISSPRYGVMSDIWSSDYDRALQKARVTKQPQSVEQEYTDADGNRKIVEIYTYPFLDENGNIAQIVETVIDITARKKAEQKLKIALKDLEDMRYALDKHAIVALTDTHGNISYVNDKFVEVSGFTRDELLGKNHRILNSDLHSKSFFRELWKTISSGQVWQGEIRNKAKDGSFYYVSSTIVPLLNEQGKPVQYISIRTDITNQKNIERQLQRAKEEAEEANRAKGTFLANMSHEIRTPLNAVLGMANLTLETKLNALQNEYLHLIKSSGENLLYLINEILDFSKIEAGKLVIASDPLLLRKTVRSVMQLFFYQGLEKGLKMNLEFDPEIPNELVGDAQRIKQILINLVGNAMKFTDTGRLDVFVTLDAVSVQKGNRQLYLKFAVSDTGIGISPEKQSLIFESFTQEDSSTTRKYGGTGLGTTISRQLVEYMGGEIGLRSPINTDPELGGPGTEFWFTIPVRLDEERRKRTNKQLRKSKMMTAVIGADEKEANVINSFCEKNRITVHHFSACEDFLLYFKANAERVDFILCLSNPKSENMQKIVGFLQSQREAKLSTKLILATDTLAIDGSYVLFDSSISEYISRPLNNHKLERAFACAVCEDEEAPTQIKDTPIAKAEELDKNGEDAPGTKGAQKNMLNILIAEDNEINQLLLKTMLEKEGYDVTLANDGQEAVEILEKKDANFHLVFMDLQMPRMNGFQATEAIRKNISPTLPIIAVTANAFKEDIERTKEAGMNDFIPKPYKKEQIYEVIERWAHQSLVE